MTTVVFRYGYDANRFVQSLRHRKVKYKRHSRTVECDRSEKRAAQLLAKLGICQGDVLNFELVEPEVGNYDIQFRESKQLKALRKRHETPLPLSGRVKVRLTGPPDELFLEVMRGLDEQD